VIAEFLFKNPRILLLTVATIVVAGTTSFFMIPRLEDPVLGKRVAVISTIYPGANALDVESLVTIPLEEQLAGISEIKQVRSNSRAGISNIVIELEDKIVDVDPVWSLVRNRLIDAGESLPTACRQSELAVFPLKAFAAIIAVKPKNPDALNFAILRRLVKILRADVLSLAGTEQVETFGDPGEEFVAEVDPSTLASLGLSVGAIAQQVSEGITKQPGGSVLGADSKLLLDLNTTSLPVRRLSESLISLGPNSEPVQLLDIANIRKRTVEPASELALSNGQAAIVLGALVDDDQQIDRWSMQLEKAIADFAASHANDVQVELLFSQRKHVDQRMFNLLKNLALGTGAIVLVVLVLMGWRSMLVVGLALPLSALMVIAGMRVLSIPIQQMSVTGLIVALGLLIDNAIVIVEEVRSRIVRGELPGPAILTAVRHLWMPLFGSTFTTALAFLPIATLPGPSGEFVGTIAVSVILAISASFVLAMTVIPALNGLMGINPEKRGLFSYGLTISAVQKLYETSLRIVFRVPVLGVLAGLVLPVWGFLAARNLPQQFFPPSDRGQIQIEVELPERDTLVSTRTAVEKIRQIVAEHENVQRQSWFLGASAPTFFYNVVPRRRGTPFYAQAFIELGEGQALQDVVRDLQNRIDERVFDCRVIVRQLEQGPPFDAPIEIRVVGPDLAQLQRLGSELRLLLSQTPNVIHTRSDLEETIPKLSLELDQVAAKKAGLSPSQISSQLYTILAGAPAGTIVDGGEEFPVLIKVAFDREASESKLDLLGSIQLPSPNRQPPILLAGPKGPQPAEASPPNPTLASLGEFRLESDVGAIVRIDRRRVNEVKAYIEAGVLPSVVVDEFKERLSKSGFVLPSGYELEFGGETEQRSNAVNNLIANAIVLFALMLLTLVVSFGSFRCAFIIAVVGGLSVGLGPLALSLFGFPFGFMAIVGTMGLIGVAINDSIVVLAAIRANVLSCAGDVDELSGVVSGCTRHVIATTLTTIVGFVPLIMGGGGFWPPLAITIAGGVGGATFLALYFVPSLHLLLRGKERVD
jgi:multidrug efflux pump subunit AcrB